MMKLSLNDFGIRPGTHEDAMPALLELLKTVRQLPPQEPVEIFCEKGRYDFFEEHASRKICYISNHDQLEPERRIAFLIEHRDRVTIDGRGSDFFFHGILIPFAFLHARSVFLKNLSVDSEFPQLHQFRILEVNPAEKELTGEMA